MKEKPLEEIITSTKKKKSEKKPGSEVSWKDLEKEKE